MIKWDDVLYRFHVFLFIDHARATAKKDPMKEGRVSPAVRLVVLESK